MPAGAVPSREACVGEHAALARVVGRQQLGAHTVGGVVSQGGGCQFSGRWNVSLESEWKNE